MEILQVLHDCVFCTQKIMNYAKKANGCNKNNQNRLNACKVTRSHSAETDQVSVMTQNIILLNFLYNLHAYVHVFGFFYKLCD